MDYITYGRSIVVILAVISFFWLAFYTVVRWVREIRSNNSSSSMGSSVTTESNSAIDSIEPPSEKQTLTPRTRVERRKKSVLPDIALDRQNSKPWWQLFLCALGVIIVTRAALLFACYAFVPTGSFLESVRSQMFRWDVGQYVLIADKWYANFGDQRLALVFFPLYPSLMRVLNLLVHDSFVSGLIISNLSLAGVSVILYKLISLDSDNESATFAVLFAIFAPFAFFFSDVFSESLFLLLTLGAVYAARRRWFMLACFLGGLSTISRLLGFIVAVPIFIEMVGALREEYLLNKKENKRWSWTNCYVVLFLAFIPLALLVYLGLNYQITGNPLEFMRIQEQHWYNTPGNLFNTIGYLFVNALTAESPINFDLWFTQFWAVSSVFALLIAARRKLRVTELAYALVYLLFAFMSDWLLSGGRYLLALYVVYPAMARLVTNRRTRVIVTAVSSMIMVFYYILFISGRNVL